MHHSISTREEITRRRWVKQFLFGTASVLCGAASTSRLIADVRSTGPGSGVLRLKLDTLPALASPGGSLQLEFISGVAPLTLNRVSVDRFVSLDSVCTHAGCTVGRFIVTSGRMRCSCHGSRYDIEGRVFRDASGNSTEPAPDDIGRYDTEFDSATGIITITIPTLSLHITSITVQNIGTNEAKRVTLVFPATAGATYEIYSQQDLTAAPTRISFSLQPNGTFQQNSVTPSTTGNISAYIDTTSLRGFYSVGIQLT